MTERRLIRLGAAASSAALLTLALVRIPAAGAVPGGAFSRPLPIPREIHALGGTTTVRAEKSAVPVLPGKRTSMWTYGGTFPGPTIRTRSGNAVRLRLVNDLPAEAGPLSLHLHGGRQKPKDDGQPHKYLINRGSARTYLYPFRSAGRPQPGAFLWYHDHHMGTAGRNMWMGLAGMFIVDNPSERALDLPRGRYEVPLMIADRAFDGKNQLVFPEGAETMPPRDAAVGDKILVNGALQPYLDVAARRYRLRLLNASNFTAYQLELSNGRSFTQIGTGQGLLPKPVKKSSILLGPSQRVDVVVDFSGLRGRKILLQSAPRSQTEVGTGTAVADLMQFRVTRSARDTSRVPPSLRSLPGWVKGAPATPDRTWVFALGTDTNGPAWTINGRTHDPTRTDATVRRDSVETWQLVNSSTVTHYIHMHGIPFVAISRNGSPPAPSEQGLEDTFRIDPGDRLLVAGRFQDYTGTFMLHCHMLEHETHGMMTQFEVVR